MDYRFEFGQDLNDEVITRPLIGHAFVGDEDSVTLLVSVTRDKEPFSLADQTIVGYCIRPDGATVAVPGIFSENVAQVTLTSECLTQQGRIRVTIKATDGETSAKTSLLQVTMTVAPSVTGTVIDGGEIIDDVSTLIQSIEDAIADCPAEHSAIMAAVAPTFSTSIAYAAGDIVWYSGTLYRFLIPHPAGSWSSDEVTAFSLSQEAADSRWALMKYNSANVLPSKEDTASTTYNGIVYTIHNGIWSMSGTVGSSNFNRNLLKTQYSLPDWWIPGRKVYVKLNKTGSMSAVRLIAYPYVNGSQGSSTVMDVSTDGEYTIPDDFSGDGLLFRLYITKNTSGISGTIRPEILLELSHSEIISKAEADDAVLDEDITHLVTSPSTTYSGMTLAEINDNVILNCNSTTFSDSPVSGIFINRRFNASYNVNLAIANGSGKMYTRIVKRSDHSVYRDWVQLAIQSDVDALPSADVALGRFASKKVYCEGDSIMYGVTTYNGGRATQTIPQTIAMRLPSSCTVDNKAHGGDRIQHTGDTSTSISDSLIADSSVSGYDYFVINGGTNDYTADVAIGAITDKANGITNTFYYGLVNMVEHILTQNPLARIMLITPIFRNYCHSTLGNAYQLQNDAGATLGDYCDAILAVGEKYCIPVYDSRKNAPFNEINYASTLHVRAADSQGYLHPTDAAYKVWGQSIASFFLANN